MANTFKVNKKQAIDLVLKIVETQMKSVILTTPTYEEYMLVKMLRDLYIPKNMELSAEKSTDLARRISHIYQELKETTDASAAAASAQASANEALGLLEWIIV